MNAHTVGYNGRNNNNNININNNDDGPQSGSAGSRKPHVVLSMSIDEHRCMVAAACGVSPTGTVIAPSRVLSAGGTVHPARRSRTPVDHLAPAGDRS